MSQSQEDEAGGCAGDDNADDDDDDDNDNDDYDDDNDEDNDNENKTSKRALNTNPPFFGTPCR